MTVDDTTCPTPSSSNFSREAGHFFFFFFFTAQDKHTCREGKEGVGGGRAGDLMRVQHSISDSKLSVKIQMF